MMRRTSSALVHLLAILLALLPIAAGAQVEPRTPPVAVFWDSPPTALPSSPRLGMNFIQPTPFWLTRARELGIAANRWQINWGDIEPQPEQWSWDRTDSETAPMLADGGLEVDLILTGTPAWASASGGPLPKNLYLAWDDPRNVWGHFVYQVATHYKDRRIRTFEIWNEPDMPGNWDGSAGDYYQLLKIAYQAVKAAQPDGVVVMAGMAHWPAPGFFEAVVAAAAEDPVASAHNQFFDVVACHWYARSDLLYDRVVWVRAILSRYGLDKPVWVNEVNVPLWGQGPEPSSPRSGYATPQEQAAFILQAHANAFAAGAERVFLFRMNDDGMAEVFGLMRNDGGRRDAYVGYYVMSKYLAHAAPESRTADNGVVRIVFRGPASERVTVLWNQTGQAVEAQAPAIAKTGVVIAQDGALRPIAAVNGAFHLSLPAATNRGDQGASDYAIGGPPLLLVEASPRPPTSHLQPLPRFAQSETFVVAWSAEEYSGLGVESYDIQVQQASGAWRDWLSGTTATSAAFRGEGGRTYAFRVRARDKQGGVEAWPARGGTETALTGAIDGVVHNAADAPVRGVQVCLGSAPCAVTDRAGSFRFLSQPPGVYPLVVRRPLVIDGMRRWLEDEVVARQCVRVALGEPRSYLVRLPAPGDAAGC